MLRRAVRCRVVVSALSAFCLATYLLFYQERLENAGGLFLDVDDVQEQRRPDVNGRDADADVVVVDYDAIRDREQISCRSPQANPWDPQLTQLVDYPRTVVCNKAVLSLTFLDDDGRLRINRTATSIVEERLRLNATLSSSSSSSLPRTDRLLDEVVFNGSGWNASDVGDRFKIRCLYRYFDRGKTDRELVFEMPAPLPETLVLKRNFVWVMCYSDGQVIYNDVYGYPALDPPSLRNMPAAAVPADAPAPDADATADADAKTVLSVLVFTLESTSVSMVHRHLWKTYRYLMEEMNAMVFSQFMKVGENTFPNLGAFFTGKRVQQQQPSMPAELVTPFGRVYDSWPFIWRNFSRAGYATAYVEDESLIGTFHYGKNGFLRRPVDYWYFPFWEAVRKARSRQPVSDRFCLNDRPLHNVHLDVLRRHLRRFGNGDGQRPQFLFSIFSALSHDFTSDVGRADDDVRDFLQEMHRSGRLNRTLLVFAGDHGPRFSKIRPTVAGFVEERQSFLAVWLPPWFRQRFPGATAALAGNRHRLVSWFDLHETLGDVLRGDFDRYNQQQPTPPPTPPTPTNATVEIRGRSLFTRIPADRTCRQAGVPDRYCLCNGIKPANVSSEFVRRLAGAVRDAVVQQTESFRNHCVVYTLSDVLYALDVRNPDAEQLGLRSFYVGIATAPMKTYFEAIVTYNATSDGIAVQRETLERLTQYQYVADCVQSLMVKKFCSCRNYRPRRAV